jgi:hypothetical protein
MRATGGSVEEKSRKPINDSRETPTVVVVVVVVGGGRGKGGGYARMSPHDRFSHDAVLLQSAPAVRLREEAPNLLKVRGHGRNHVHDLMDHFRRESTWESERGGGQWPNLKVSMSRKLRPELASS